MHAILTLFLYGSIPPELGNLHNLIDLEIDYNQLTGSIPPELGKLANLGWLYLNSNRLTGSIPLELMDLKSLTDLKYAITIYIRPILTFEIF